MKKALILVLASVTGMSVALGAYADDYICLLYTSPSPRDS